MDELEEELEKMAGKLVKLVLPFSADLMFSFEIVGYLMPKNGYPAGYEVRLAGDESSLWFLSDAVHFIKAHALTVVLKVRTS